MEIKNFTITKRDGTKDRFSLDKIMNAIVKAFESVDEPADLGTVSKILSHLDMHDDIKVEDIQNQVEEALMREGFYRVAKSFILYRQEHTEDRDTCGTQEHRHVDWRVTQIELHPSEPSPAGRPYQKDVWQRPGQ